MRVVDSDAHVNENPLAWTELASKYPEWITFGAADGRPAAIIEGRRYPQQVGRGRGVPIESAIAESAQAGAFDLPQRLIDMDREGIDQQVLYGGLSIGTTSFTDHGFAIDFARAYNDWLLTEVCAHAPDRLKGVGVVPLQDIAASVDEVARLATLGAVAITIPPAIAGPDGSPVTIDAPTISPFWEACIDADLAVGIHNAPGMHTLLPAADLFDNYAQVHQLSFPVDQMVAFTALAMGGVLDQFPRLRVAFLECGVGWVPYFLDRMNEHREKRGELLPDMKSQPAEFIERGQCYFSFECEDLFVAHFIEHFGSDAVMFSSDYPHWDSEFPGTVTASLAENSDLGDEVLAKIMGANAARLYNL